MGIVAIHDMSQTSVFGCWRVLSAPLERTACHHRERYVRYREVPMPRCPWRGKSGPFRPFVLRPCASNRILMHIGVKPLNAKINQTYMGLF